jgi:hypothetical protein
VTPLIIGGIITALTLASLGLMVWTIWTAPVGHENESGFHYGEPDEHADSDNLGI